MLSTAPEFEPESLASASFFRQKDFKLFKFDYIKTYSFKDLELIAGQIVFIITKFFYQKYRE